MACTRETGLKGHVLKDTQGRAGVTVLAAEADDQEDGRRIGRDEQGLEDAHAALVAPLQVIDPQDQGPRVGQTGEQLTQGGEGVGALDLWTAIGNQERIVFANSQMAPKLMDQGRIAEGIVMLENGLKANEAIGDTLFIATNHNGLGSAYLGLGDYARAIDHYNKSIALFMTMDDENAYRYLGDALADMGLIHADLHQADSAKRYYRGSALAYRSGNVPGRAIIPLLDLGTILRDGGDQAGWHAVLAEVRALAYTGPAPGD